MQSGASTGVEVGKSFPRTSPTGGKKMKLLICCLETVCESARFFFVCLYYYFFKFIQDYNPSNIFGARDWSKHVT